MATQAAKKQIQKSIKQVVKLMEELSSAGISRDSVEKGVFALNLFTVLPKGKAYAADWGVVKYCLEQGAIDRDVFELTMRATRFLK